MLSALPKEKVKKLSDPEHQTILADLQQPSAEIVRLQQAYPLCSSRAERKDFDAKSISMMPDLTKNICEMLFNHWNMVSVDANYQQLLLQFNRDFSNLLNTKSNQEIIQALQYTFPAIECGCPSVVYQRRLQINGIVVNENLIKIQDLYMQARIGSHNNHLISNNVILLALSINSGSAAEILLKKCIAIYDDPFTSREMQKQIKDIINYKNKFNWGLVTMSTVLSPCDCATPDIDNIWRIILDNTQKFSIDFTTFVNPFMPGIIKCNLPLFFYANHGAMWTVFDDLHKKNRQDIVESLFKETINYFDLQNVRRNREEELTIYRSIYQMLDAKIKDQDFKNRLIKLMEEKFTKHHSIGSASPKF